MPLRKLMTENGQESLYKKLNNISNDDALRVLRGFADKLPLKGNFAKILSQALESGDLDEQNFALAGPHECFLDGFYAEGEKRSYPAIFIIEIERQTALSNHLLQKGNVQDAVKILLQQPIATHLFWKESIEIFTNAKKPTELNMLNISVSFEILIAILAARDIEVAHKNNIDISVLESILPTTKTENKNPTTLLYESFKRAISVTSIHDLMDKTSKGDISFDESFFKRWSSGKQLPSHSRFSELIRNNLDSKEVELMQWKYFAVKILNFIGYASQEICRRMRHESISDDQRVLFKPFPRCPFSYSTMTEWLENRYPYWLNYHKQEFGRRD